MDRPPRALSLFSGIGGLDLGVRAACGANTVGYVEREAFAAAVLLARMEEKVLEPAPVWCGGIEELDWTPFVGQVDVVIAGFPCQDVSIAGKRIGLERGERTGLWREVVRCIRTVRPPIVFLENVPGLVKRGLNRVLADLHACGFDAEWDLFRAEEVEAPHRRSRWFLLGSRYVSDSECNPLWDLTERGDGPARSPESWDSQSEDLGQSMADGLGKRLEGVEQGWSETGAALRGDGVEVADPYSRGLEVGGVEERGKYEGSYGSEPFGRRHYGGLLWPPGPKDADGWERWILAGGPPPATQSKLRRGSHGVSRRLDESRADRLRCLGNAVVPAQAELAFRVLAGRLLGNRE